MRQLATVKVARPRNLKDKAFVLFQLFCLVVPGRDGPLGVVRVDGHELTLVRFETKRERQQTVIHKTGRLPTVPPHLFVSRLQQFVEAVFDLYVPFAPARRAYARRACGGYGGQLGGSCIKSLEVVFVFLEARDDLLKVGRAASALPLLTAARGVPSCAVVGLRLRRERPDMQSRKSKNLEK